MAMNGAPAGNSSIGALSFDLAHSPSKWIEIYPGVHRGSALPSQSMTGRIRASLGKTARFIQADLPTG